MPIFRYQALNAAQQLVAGQIEADAVARAIAQLEAAGLSVQSIGFAPADESPGEQPPTVFHAAADSSAPSPSTPDIAAERALLESHLGKVLAQGQTIIPALSAYAEEMPSGSRRRQLQTVCQVLQQGNAAEAARALGDLPEYWIPLLSAAASSNDPGRVLREFLEESQRADELRRQWWATVSYPALVLLIAGVVLVWFAVLVVPAFRDIFNDFDLNLPWLTTVVVNFAGFIASGQALIALAVVVVVVMLPLAASRLTPGSLGGWLNDKLGSLLGRSTAIAQFSRFTADLLEAGIDAPSALRIAGFTSRRPRLRRAGWQLAHALEAAAFVPQSDARALTATVLHALRTDMPLESRVRLLKQISLCYAQRTRDRISWTRGILEPFIISIVGFIVGTIVIALFLPLVTLINNLTG